jgi:glucosamine-6-phosphate deaminase
MVDHLFGHVNIESGNVNLPNGEVSDSAAECAAYEEKIAAHGIDLQILGIGNNGHIGFNEPADHFTALTHCAALDASTIKANARFFATESDVPKHSITMGIKSIFAAKKILLLAGGANKADAIFKTIRGKITPQVPASILQLHPNVTFILDKDAAKNISG